MTAVSRIVPSGELAAHLISLVSMAGPVLAVFSTAPSRVCQPSPSTCHDGRDISHPLQESADGLYKAARWAGFKWAAVLGLSSFGVLTLVTAHFREIPPVFSIVGAGMMAMVGCAIGIVKSWRL